jgi:hypothetical protein
MSAPLSTLIHGNLTVETGCDTSLYGSGDITVNNNAYINGSGDSTSSSSGALVVAGGIGVGLTASIGGNLFVTAGNTSLGSTSINTYNGSFSVFGQNAISLTSSTTSSFTTSLGDLTLDAQSGYTVLKSGINASNAVQITGTNAGGGVAILSGATSQITLTAGSGGIQGLASGGSINLISNAGASSFIVNSSSANQSLTIGVNGSTDSSLILQSAGTNTQAILLNTSSSNGSIAIENQGGLGVGNVNILAGSGGLNVFTNTGGSINLTANAAASYFVVNTTASNQNLTLGINGASNSSLILQSSGTNATQAILIQTTNTAGGINIVQPLSSSAGVQIYPGSGGLNVLTQNGGGINLIAVGAPSSFINKTNSNGQDLTLCVQSTGVTNSSSLILCNQGGGAINVNTASGGNVNVSASGPVFINSSNTSTGINIGTLQNVPVTIGTSNSTTTIKGNLDVQGITTTIQSTVVTIVDNIIELNNGPTGTADSGVAVKRYQPWIDGTYNSSGNTCTGITGDVVNDVADNYNSGAYNLVGSLSNTATIITLDIVNDSNVSIPGYYNGWWIKTLPNSSGSIITGACQVRRIKTHNADGTAVIYSTADETAVPNTPHQGHDFTTIPVAGLRYGLYPCQWIISMWDAVNNEFCIICSPMQNATATPPIAHYVNLHVNNITANAITATTVNGTTADVQGTFNLVNANTTPVFITLPSNNTYGVYFVMVRPTTLTTTRTHAIFAIGRLNSTTACGTVVRIISVKGVNGEMLDMQWGAGVAPSIFYRPAPGGATTTSFTYKVITV